jgi:hypothetical protein
MFNDKEQKMSAYIVSDRHVAVFVVGANLHRHSSVEPDVLLKQAKLLMRENVRSVNYRYGEKSRSPSIVINKGHEVAAEAMSLEDLIMMGRCLRYQSCETDDYETTKAATLLNGLLLEMYEKLFGDCVSKASNVWSI